MEFTAVIAFRNMTQPDKDRPGDRRSGVLQDVRAGSGAALGEVCGVRMSEDAFACHRNLLFTVAYEVLGSAVRPAGCIYDGVAPLEDGLYDIG